MSGSPVVVLTVVGALGTVFATATSWLVRRDEKRGFVAVEPRSRAVEPPQVPEPKAERVRPVKERPVKERAVKERAVKPVKEPRVRRPRPPRELSRPEPQPEAVEETVEVLSMPDPRRESLVLNLDAFTEFRSR